ncbi:MAG TPA: GxxExxY protein [Vicinamibacteria bacterium]|nr:GxxExxY protein [Vicinamibacteria bacterium]
MPEQPLDAITESIIGAAMAVHRALGPGLLESAYETCLEFEIRDRGLAVERQKPLALAYRDVRLECAYRLDLVVESCVVVEIKALEQLARIHSVQLLSYLRLTGCRVGLLINFHSYALRDGIRRVVNGYPDSPEALRSRRPSAFSALKGSAT